MSSWFVLEIISPPLDCRRVRVYNRHTGTPYKIQKNILHRVFREGKVMDITHMRNNIFYNKRDKYVQISIGDENYSIAINYLREIAAGVDNYGEVPPPGDGEWEQL